MANQRTNSKPARIVSQLIAIGLLALLLLMPFHAAISVVLGTGLNHMAAVQAWKEAVIVIMAVLALVLWLLRRKLPIKLDGINYLVLGIIGLSLAVSLAQWHGLRMLAFGIKTDLFPLVVFLLAQLPLPGVGERRVRAIVLVPAAVVALLAVWQAAAVPVDWLARLGYGPNTINPMQIVDGSLKLTRAFATLGGPNQLGAYLILPISLSLAWLVRERKFVYALLLPLLLSALVLSYSRSAWLGAALAIVLVVVLCLPWRWQIGVGVAAVVLALMAGVLISRSVNAPTTSSWQRILLHGRNFNNQIQGSDQSRLGAAKQALGDIGRQPLGYGLGTAGPASKQSEVTRITENGYLQIGLETGIAGLVAVLVLFGWLLVELWQGRAGAVGVWSIALFGGLAGVLVANLFLHALADSTLAIMLFGLLGLNRRWRA